MTLVQIIRRWDTSRRFKNRTCIRLLPLFFLASAQMVQAASETEAGPEHTASVTFVWMAVILIAAKISSLVERFGQPSVLGELVIGVILGNLALVGIPWFEPIKTNHLIEFLSELGVVILLFQIGLESNIQKMKSVGVRAFLVACIGVIVPFVLGTYVVGPWLLPGLTAHAYLFLGATLTATSVGITARVFQDLNKLQTLEAQIVLGAAVIDDVLGLIILAVVSAIVTVGSVTLGTISWITTEAVLFLVLSIVIGQLLAPSIGRLFAKIHTGDGMKLTVAVSFGLVLAFAAEEIGLAPIVGAFAAGLVLDPVHFKFFRDPQFVEDVQETVNRSTDPNTKQKLLQVMEAHSHRHVEDLIQPIGYFLVPIFFVYTGINTRLETLFNIPILLVALGITIVAFIGKIVAGLVAGKVNKWIVGYGMIPRGEVGLIFAVMGKQLGVVSDQLFSAIIIMVIVSTLATPPILTYLIKRQEHKETAIAAVTE